MSSSQSPTSHSSGFEAYVVSLAAQANQAAQRKLHPDFETWQACFDYVNSTGPLAIDLPVGSRTNLELMRLFDALRKQALELVNIGDKPGHVAICTAAQAVELKAQMPSHPGQIRNYLGGPLKPA